MSKIIGKDEIVNISKVQPNTWNPKESIEESSDNMKHFLEIKKEIEKKGLFEAITVRELKDNYEILDGYHRWTACKELDYTEIRVNNLGKIDDKLARAITLIKEQKKVPVSELKVAEVVGWFRQNEDEEAIKDLLGYSDSIFDEYSKLLDFDLPSTTNTKNGVELYQVLISCNTKEEQEKLYNDFTKEGYNCEMLLH